jgi:putative colanic acid biosynthesis acetyltransferase WcaF
MTTPRTTLTAEPAPGRERAAARADPYLAPAHGLRNRIARAAWELARLALFRLSPRPCHAWRAALLRLFGAKLGRDCHVYPSARIWAPWNLACEDVVAIADEAIVYNPAPVRLGSHCVVSQQAYLCGAGHDPADPAFRLVSAPIEVGAYAWICARATVQMGVRVGEGAVLALGAVATRDLEPWTVYGGVPARALKRRTRERR